jgi:D-lactate dehydrogenase (cytochrome)
MGKRELLLAQYGPEGVALMRTLKRALDPDDLLNPGKILPPA